MKDRAISLNAVIDALHQSINLFEAEDRIRDLPSVIPCEDAISRILNRMWNCRGKHTTSIDKIKMEQIIRDELSPVKPQEPKWIHVSEKMPKDGQHVLFCDMEDEVLQIIDKYIANNKDMQWKMENCCCMEVNNG